MGCFDDVTGKLGFGLMRLPKTEGAIDVDQVIPMVDAFLAAGFNYFDTAWAYVGSEEATRKALPDAYAVLDALNAVESVRNEGRRPSAIRGLP